ncbi:MAG: S41 family peptidase, partial [Kangiellaceae bacterium]|nr:S41 family peptidase [Kangiellaceae bacterium]
MLGLISCHKIFLRSTRIYTYACILFVLSGCASFAPVLSPADVNNENYSAGNQDNVSDKNVDNKKENATKRISKFSLIAPDLLKLDLKQFVSKIIEIHPEPFELISETSFRNKVSVIKQSLRYPITRSEFYLRVAPLIAELQDIHTQIRLPENLFNKLSFDKQLTDNKNTKLFPLAVLYEQSGLYVATDLSKTPTIPIGARLIQINSAPVDFLLSTMKRLTVYETETGQRRKIQIDFPWLLAVMGYANNEYEITYQWQNETYSRRIAGIVPLNRPLDNTEDQPNENRSSTNMESFYGFSQLSQQTALLWFNDFNEHPKVFKKFLKQHFREFAGNGLANLIIDLRYNDGGLSKNVRTFLSYLTSQPIHWNQLGEIKISKPLKSLHRKKTRQRRKSKYKWGLQWLPLEWTDYLQYEISWSEIGEKVKVEFEPIEPSGVLAPPNIIVLTNGYCFSACSAFVATVNKEHLALTMGEIPGNFARVQYGY